METERTLADDKWVRIMADFCAEAIWCKDGAGTSIEELPVTPELRDRILAWQHWYDDQCEGYLPPSERTTQFDYAAFSAKGLALALEVKRQLPDWTVIYFDEERSNKVPALDYEYEVRVDGQLTHD